MKNTWLYNWLYKMIFLWIFLLNNCALYAADSNDDGKSRAAAPVRAPALQMMGTQPATSAVDPCRIISDKNAQTRVLVIDGGGTRGAYAAAVLQQMEEFHHQRICDLFQGGITGTSTGSFIALALTAPQHREADGKMHPGPYSAKDVVNFYKTMGNDIFKCCTLANCCENAGTCFTGCGGFFWNMATCFGCFACCKNCDGLCGPRYSNAALEQALRDRFGDMELGQALIPVQVVAYDIGQNKPAYFNSKQHRHFKMKDVALASSAAPTYFPAVTIKDSDNVTRQCVDGGIFDNSAGIAALKFALQQQEEKKPPVVLMERIKTKSIDDFILVSIGTGSATLASRYNRLVRAGKIVWASEAIEISITGTAQAADENLREIFRVKLGIGEKGYFRIQTALNERESSLDDVTIIDGLISRAKYHPEPDYTDFIERHLKQEMSHNLAQIAHTIHIAAAGTTTTAAAAAASKLEVDDKKKDADQSKH